MHSDKSVVLFVLYLLIIEFDYLNQNSQLVKDILIKSFFEIIVYKIFNSRHCSQAKFLKTPQKIPKTFQNVSLTKNLTQKLASFKKYHQKLLYASSPRISKKILLFLTNKQDFAFLGNFFVLLIFIILFK